MTPQEYVEWIAYFELKDVKMKQEAKKIEAQNKTQPKSKRYS